MGFLFKYEFRNVRFISGCVVEEGTIRRHRFDRRHWRKHTQEKSSLAFVRNCLEFIIARRESIAAVSTCRNPLNYMWNIWNIYTENCLLWSASYLSHAIICDISFLPLVEETVSNGSRVLSRPSPGGGGSVIGSQSSQNQLIDFPISVSRLSPVQCLSSAATLLPLKIASPAAHLFQLQPRRNTKKSWTAIEKFNYNWLSSLSLFF